MFHKVWHNSCGLKVQFLLNYRASTWVQGKTYYIAARGFSIKSTYLYKFLILQKKTLPPNGVYKGTNSAAVVKWHT